MGFGCHVIKMRKMHCVYGIRILTIQMSDHIPQLKHACRRVRQISSWTGLQTRDGCDPMQASKPATNR